jgi:hypothetical protein
MRVHITCKQYEDEHEYFFHMMQCTSLEITMTLRVGAHLH